MEIIVYMAEMFGNTIKNSFLSMAELIVSEMFLYKKKPFSYLFLILFLVHILKLFSWYAFL